MVPFGEMHGYKWFTSSTSSDNIHTMVKSPFEEIDNDECIHIRFSGVTTDTKVINVGVMAKNDMIPLCASRMITSNGSVLISRNIAISSITKNLLEDDTAVQMMAKLNNNSNELCVYVDVVGKMPTIETERFHFDGLVNVPPSISIASRNIRGLDVENISTDVVKNTIKIAANMEYLKFQEGYKARRLYTKDMMEWLNSDKEDMIAVTEESQEWSDEYCFSDCTTRFITDELHESNIVVYFINHKELGMSSYSRVSLIDKSGGEVYATEPREDNRIGNFIHRENIHVPIGTRCQIVETIYGNPAPFYETVRPVSTFSYDYVSKSLSI